jgi:hypothetical protein
MNELVKNDYLISILHIQYIQRVYPVDPSTTHTKLVQVVQPKVQVTTNQPLQRSIQQVKSMMSFSAMTTPVN